MKIIHLTDLHIMPQGQTILESDTNARLQRAIADINAHHADAAFCVITGDLTHNGDAGSYQALEAMLGELRVPAHLMIGNHDARDVAFAHLSRLSPDATGFAQSVVETAHGDFLLLDTKTEGTHAGAYCAARRDWLAAQLAQRADRPIWLFTHHAPFRTGLKAMDQIGLDPSDAAALGDLATAHGGVRHLFFGHYHRPMSGTWRGIPFSSHRSLMMQCQLDLANENEVRGIYEEPQYAVVLIGADQTLIHLHDFDSGAAQRSLGAPED